MKDLLCLLVSHSCVADATALLIAQRVRLGLPAAVEDSCDPAASSGWGKLWGASAAANAANAATAAATATVAAAATTTAATVAAATDAFG